MVFISCAGTSHERDIESESGSQSARSMNFSRVGTRGTAHASRSRPVVGERRRPTMTVDDRLLADVRDGRWLRPAGRHRFAVGFSAAELGPAAEVALAERTRPP